MIVEMDEDELSEEEEHDDDEWYLVCNWL
jgi:hypothetical protein